MKILKLSIFFVFLSLSVFCQTDAGATVTTFVYIENPYKNQESGKEYEIKSFQLTNVDTLGKKNYKFPTISSFDKDDNGYFVKLEVPEKVLNNSSNIWCRAKVKGGSYNGTMTVKYGGVRFSKIKLVIKSSPEGAETFIIPNRIWEQKLSTVNLNDTVLQNYRVNTSTTNTYAYIDETVYVIICKKGDQFKRITHFTKPATIEKVQIVSINFDKWWTAYPTFLN